MQLGVEVVDGVIPIIERPLVAVKSNAVVRHAMSISWHLRVDEDVLRPALNNARLTNRLVRRAVILACLHEQWSMCGKGRHLRMHARLGSNL